MGGGVAVGHASFDVGGKISRCVGAACFRAHITAGLVAADLGHSFAAPTRDCGLQMIGLSAAAVMAIAVSCHIPGVPLPRIVAAAEVESGLQALAIHDNTTERSFVPTSRAEAIATADFLLRSGHRIDAGLMQVASTSWARFGLTLQSAFDPAANVCAGAPVLAEDYAIERRVSCRYNTGRPLCTNGYPERIQRAMSSSAMPQLVGAIGPSLLRTLPTPSQPKFAPVYDEPAGAGLETVFAGGSR